MSSNLAGGVTIGPSSSFFCAAPSRTPASPTASATSDSDGGRVGVSLVSETAPKQTVFPSSPQADVTTSTSGDDRGFSCPLSGVVGRADSGDVHESVAWSAAFAAFFWVSTSEQCAMAWHWHCVKGRALILTGPTPTSWCGMVLDEPDKTSTIIGIKFVMWVRYMFVWRNKRKRLGISKWMDF